MSNTENGRLFSLDSFGEQIALIGHDATLTYRELGSMSERVVENIPSRSLVLFVADNTIASVAAYIGMLNAKIIPLMIKKDASIDVISEINETYQASYIWCSDNLSIHGDEVYRKDGHSLVATGRKSPTVDDRLALLLTTSGSTGSRKYVRLSYENIKSNTESIIEYLKIVPSDRAITTLPFSYTYGISIINTHLYAGASIVVTEKDILSRDFWNECHDHAITTFGGVPYTYQMLKRLHFERMDIPSLRYLTQAGGHLDTELQKEFGKACMDKGVDFVIMYGQTEATARLSYLPANHVLDKVGSIGVAIPGGTFSLIDVDGSTIEEPNQAGELVYHGANVSLGYARCAEDLALGDERGGVLETGDIAKRDDDGFYYIVGRKKRFLKVFGNRVNLDEAEQLLNKEGFLCACSGKDDEVVVFLESGKPEDARKFISESTGLNRSVFKIVSIESIPRNDAGKILYSALGELLQ